LQKAGTGDLFLAWVRDTHCDQVVDACRPFQGPLKFLVQEITHQEDDCPPVKHPAKKI
jgi:hypothetical protein